jgi:predicted Zn-dependent protease
MINLRLDKVSEAVDLLEKAFNLEPRNLLIVLHFAEALVADGKRSKAEIIISPFLNRSDELDSEIERVLRVKL